MKRAFRLILSLICSVIIFLIAVPILLSLLLQVGTVQNYIAGRLTGWLSETTGTTVSVRRIDIGFFNRAIFEGAYVQDYNGDTLIYADRLSIGINTLNFLTGETALGSVTLQDGQVHLREDSSGMLNMQRFIEPLTPETPRNWENFRLDASEFNLRNIRFTFRKYRPEYRANGINFQDLDLQDFWFELRNLHLHGANMRFRLSRMSFREKSGFAVDRLSSRLAVVDSTGMRFTDFRLHTPDSRVAMERFNLLYDDFSAFGNFARDVRLDISFHPSLLAYRTLAYFFRQPSDLPLTLDFEGQAEGPLADLDGHLWRVRSGRTELDLTFHATGLPDVGQARFRIEVGELITDATGVLDLYRSVSGGRTLGDPVEKVLTRTGRIGFTGNFDGRIRDFTATGQLTTEQGILLGQVEFTPGQREGANRFTGHLLAEDYRLGSLLELRQLGNVTFDAHVTAHSDSGRMQLLTRAGIGQLWYGGYNYHDIRLDGRFEGRAFTGQITSDDPNLDFTTDGHFDLAAEVPSYDFEMELRRADLVALGINRRDSISTLSARFRAHAAGSTLDDIDGDASIDSLRYTNHIDTVRTGPIRFEAQSSGQSRSISMRSAFADIDLRAQSSYGNLFRYLSESLRSYMPSLPTLEEVGLASAVPGRLRRYNPTEADNGYYLLQVNVKEANNVAAIFVPGLEIAQGSSLSFLFNPYLDQFSLSVKSDYIQRQDLFIGELSVESRNQGDSVSIYASAEEFGLGSIDLPNLSLVGGIKDNRVNLATRFVNPDNGTNALISTTTAIQRSPRGLPQLDIAFHPTSFTIDNQNWYIVPGRILIDTTGIEFRNFRLNGEGQRLSIEGRASASESDTLRVALQNFNLSPLTRLVSRQGYRVSGRLGGDFELVAPRGDMRFAAQMQIDSLGLNDHRFGHVDFNSGWDAPRRWVVFNFTTPDAERPVTGVYDSRENRARIDFRFPRFDMSLLEPLLNGILAETRGQADARLTLLLDDGKPVLSGTVDVESYEAKVLYTNTRYSFAGPVSVVDNRFELPSVPISDGAGGGGQIQGWFDSEYFRKLRFGVQVDFTNLLALNTTLSDNDVFYGRIYGTGNLSVTGDDWTTNLDIRAETAPGSNFVLPLSDILQIGEADFISFADTTGRPQRDPAQVRRRRPQRQERIRAKSELRVDMNLVVPNNTTDVQIVMDARLGDAIRGRGNGRFHLYLVPDQDIFTMDGQFNITEGTYLFTLYGALANKYFVIQPNSEISWTGDPADPYVNIQGIYRVRTSLRPLLGANTTVGTGNVNLNAGIHLTGRLFQPDIGLTITAPGADPETQNLLTNLLNTEEARTTQFAYLMLTNSFMPDNQLNSIGTMGGSLAGVAGMEFLSNQISNLISGTNYNIRFGYRPQSDLTSEELTFDFGADIISNKLTFEVGGNYDISQNGMYSNPNNPLSVDGYLTWVLNRTGTLKIKGFTRTIDRFDESQGLQDNGIGIYYRQDFQNWNDLSLRYRRWRENAQRQRAVRRDLRTERKEERRTGQAVMPQEEEAAEESVQQP